MFTACTVILYILDGVVWYWELLFSGRCNLSSIEELNFRLCLLIFEPLFKTYLLLLILLKVYVYCYIVSVVFCSLSCGRSVQVYVDSSVDTGYTTRTGQLLVPLHQQLLACTEYGDASWTTTTSVYSLYMYVYKAMVIIQIKNRPVWF